MSKTKPARASRASSTKRSAATRRRRRPDPPVTFTLRSGDTQARLVLRTEGARRPVRMRLALDAASARTLRATLERLGREDVKRHLGKVGVAKELGAPELRALLAATKQAIEALSTALRRRGPARATLDFNTTPRLGAGRVEMAFSVLRPRRRTTRRARPSAPPARSAAS